MSITSSYIIFAAFGLFGATYVATKVLHFVIVFARPGSLHRYRRSSDSWALVTGASSGIGLSFAQELCRQDFNVIIHGRNLSKLEKIKAKLNHQFPDCTVRMAVADASQSDAPERLAASVRDLHLTVLINNIGGIMGIVTPQFKPFERQTAQEISDTIDLNNRFTMQLTNALFPTLKANEPSLVLNIGSLVANMKIPYLTVYAATKAGLMSWSANLAAEMRLEGRKIEVLGILVGNTSTEGRHSIPTTFTTPTARAMARSALQKVGCGVDVMPGYLPHALQQASLKITPAWILAIFVGKKATALKESDPEAYYFVLSFQSSAQDCAFQTLIL